MERIIEKDTRAKRSKTIKKVLATPILERLNMSKTRTLNKVKLEIAKPVLVKHNGWGGRRKGAGRKPLSFIETEKRMRTMDFDKLFKKVQRLYNKTSKEKAKSGEDLHFGKIRKRNYDYLIKNKGIDEARSKLLGAYRYAKGLAQEEYFTTMLDDLKYFKDKASISEEDRQKLEEAITKLESKGTISKTDLDEIRELWYDAKNGNITADSLIEGIADKIKDL